MTVWMIREETEAQDLVRHDHINQVREMVGVTAGHVVCAAIDRGLLAIEEAAREVGAEVLAGSGQEVHEDSEVEGDAVGTEDHADSRLEQNQTIQISRKFMSLASQEAPLLKTLRKYSKPAVR